MRFTTYQNLCNSLLIVLIFLVGCDSVPVKTGVWKNKEIPADKADKLRQLNTDLFKAIKTDRDDAELLLSKQYLQQKNIKVQFDYINKLRSEDEYVLLQDYYIVNKGVSDEDLKTIDHPELRYEPLAKEMYIASFIPKHKQNKLMLTVVYAKYNIGWKANQVALGYYTQQGKTSTELYELAKEDYAKGHLVNAINNITLAMNCAPGGYLRQPNGEEIKKFTEMVVEEANSKINYPFVLNNIASKPAIFSISSNSKEDGVTQYIYYLTNLKLTDSAALKKENEQVKLQLPTIFPGIDKGKKTMFYSAMNEKPKAGKSIDHADFEEKINN